jgi:Sigma-70 region 2
LQKPSSGTAHQAAFLRAYQDMVYATAKRITASKSHVEDIAQDVFLKACARLAAPKGVSLLQVKRAGEISTANRRVGQPRRDSTPCEPR